MSAVYAVYVRERQLNVRLNVAEYRAVRHWAFVKETSMSELARAALMEKVERMTQQKLESDQQLTWTGKTT